MVSWTGYVKASLMVPTKASLTVPTTASLTVPINAYSILPMEAHSMACNTDFSGESLMAPAK